MSRYYRSLAIVLMLALAATACGAGGGTQDQTAKPAPTPTAVVGRLTINIKDNKFVPALATITGGTTVTWVNQDAAAHTVTAGPRDNPDSLFDSGPIQPGQSFKFTFYMQDEYPYYCADHQGEEGKIVVQ